MTVGVDPKRFSIVRGRNVCILGYRSTGRGRGLLRNVNTAAYRRAITRARLRPLPTNSDCEGDTGVFVSRYDFTNRF